MSRTILKPDLIIIYCKYVSAARQDDRLPLSSIPWPVWAPMESQLAMGESLVKDLEKESGPLHENVLQVGIK